MELIFIILMDGQGLDQVLFFILQVINYHLKRFHIILQFIIIFLIYCYYSYLFVLQYFYYFFYFYFYLFIYFFLFISFILSSYELSIILITWFILCFLCLFYLFCCYSIPSQRLIIFINQKQQSFLKFIVNILDLVDQVYLNILLFNDQFPSNY